MEVSVGCNLVEIFLIPLDAFPISLIMKKKSLNFPINCY